MTAKKQTFKPVFIARDSEGAILSVFRAPQPAMSFVAEYLSGDTATTLVVEHGDASFHDMNPKLLKELSTGMSQGSARAFRVRVAEDSAELTGARVALSAMREMHDKMADMGAELPADVRKAQLAPLVAAVETLESANDDGGPFVTLEAHEPRTRAYNSVGERGEPQEPTPEPTPEPESASERASAFRASVGLK